MKMSGRCLRLLSSEAGHNKDSEKGKRSIAKSLIFLLLYLVLSCDKEFYNLIC